VTPEQRQRIDDLFQAALDVGQEARSAWLDSACGDDSLVRAEVQRLLNRQESAADLTEPLSGLESQPPESLPGDAPERIGAYELIRVIGTGGMGMVYEAVQDNPRRTVALKLMHRAVASPSGLRRFEHEAQILGQLRHPGIAQVYDAGTHTYGSQTVPYFVMELIDGVSLTTYAELHTLDVRHRLELITKVCDAVQHGHQKGVIHRDLKPANILVDATGQPRVIDFGVARVTDEDLLVTTLHTDVGQFVGTLPYMSPEQMGGDPADLDTRLDVYALGVVCYELLTGRLPHDVMGKSVAEVARIVQDEDARLASTINSLFRGDIDTILAKALEKDKTRRYESASALATDIRRYLNDEPIAARPASTFYQLRKFARRNRAIVAGAAFAVLGLIGGTAFATWKAIEATDERNRARAAEQQVRAQAEATRIEARKAKRINRFLQDMLAAADPEQARGRDLSVRDMLDRAANRIDTELADEPEVAAALHYTVGATYRGLGLYAAAEPHLQRALELRTGLLGAGAAETLYAMHALAVLYYDLGRLREAESLCRQTIDMATRTLGEEEGVTLSAANQLALLLQDQGRLSEAEPHFRHVLAARRRLAGPEDPQTLLSLNNLAWLLATRGEQNEASELFEETLAIRRRVSGDDHPETLRTMVNLAGSLRALGDVERAEPLAVEAAEGCRRVLGENHGLTLYAMDRLAGLYAQTDRLREAEDLARETLALRRKALGEDHPHTLWSMNTLVTVLTRSGKFEEAAQLARRTLEARQQRLGPEHPATLASANSLAVALMLGDGAPEAETLLRELVETHERVDGEDDADTLRVTHNLALTLERQGRASEAEPLFARVHEARARELGPNHADTLAAARGVAYAKLGQGHFREAETLLREILGAAEDVLPIEHEVVLDTRRDLGRCLTRLERWEEAEPEFLAVYAAFETRYGVDDWRVRLAAKRLVSLYEAWGRPRRAEPYQQLLASEKQKSTVESGTE
jgi:serine/threonine protein kinase